MSRPIELHYWPTPNGWKISIAIEEMGLPYETVAVNIGAGDQFKPGFQAISRNGRMPAIVDPEGPDDRCCSASAPGVDTSDLVSRGCVFLSRGTKQMLVK